MIEPLDTIIVGGGIAGLTMAYELSKHAPERRYALIEASGQLGGKIRTETVELPDGRALIEFGPDSVLTQKPWARARFTDLELEGQIIPINPVPSPVRVLHRGRLRPMPAGLSLIVPTAIGPFVLSPLLSPLAKARVGFELLKPARHDEGDESLGAFVRRRFGTEPLDLIAEPIAAGIYNADPDELSLLATFPQLRELEREYGSVIRGARAAKRARGAGTSGPAFVSLRNGMQTLVDALLPRLTGELRTGAAVTALDRRTTDEFVLSTNGGEMLVTRSVVLAVPAAAAANLLGAIAPEAARALAELRTRAAGSTSFIFPPGAIAQPLPGYGLVVPASECRPFNAITVASAKFPERAPAGWTVLRVFFGGARSPETAELPEERIETVLRGELKALLGIAKPPLAIRTMRWLAGSPQYDVGHLDRVAAIEAALPPGIFVTGSPYRGVGLPDVIRQAQQCAAELFAGLAGSPVSVA